MTIVRLAIFWCLGIWLANRTTWSLLLWAIGVGLGAILFIALRDRSRSRFAIACFIALSAGGTRAAARVPHINVGHVAFYSNSSEVTLIGSVVEEPQIRDQRVDLILQAETIQLPDQPPQPIEGRVLVQTPRFPVIPYNARLRVTGYLQEPPASATFDYGAYLERRDIFRLMRYPELELLSQEQGRPFYKNLYLFKTRARETLYRQIPDPEASLLSGILLGDESGLPEELEEDFRTTGMTHIIAISGFNIAILAGVLLRGTRPFLGHRHPTWIALTGVFLYTILVGADASVVRAAIMGSLYITASRILGRPTFAPASLFVAAVAMSLVNPFVLWDVGFQLSFAATLGLMLYAEPFSRWTQAHLERWVQPNWAIRLMPFISETILVTFAAQLLTLPLLAYHFKQISLASVPANLLILPAQPAVMLWGGLSILTGMLAPFLGQLFAWVAWLFLAYTTAMVRLLAELPFAVLDVEVGLLTVIAFYVLIFAATWLLRAKPERRRTLLEGAWQQAPQSALGFSLLVALLTWQYQATQPDGLLHVAFLDVGQGDAIFIETPSGRQLLVDGGQHPTVLNARLGRQMPFWDRHVDVVVATHPDEDHVAGLPGVFDRYRVDTLLTSRTIENVSSTYELLLQEAEEDGVMIYAPQAGERLAIGDGVALEFVHPGPIQLKDDNDNSIAFRLIYGNFSLLLTGDAEQEGESMMVRTELPLQSYVLKAGHHGSRTSSNDFFLEAVQPRIIVVSAGADNSFGHPHPEVLQRAHDVGALVLRTDELGTIEVVTDGEQMWWEAATK